MQSITISEAQRLTSPNPFAIVSSMDRDGQCDLMAISWWTYMTNNPPMLGICTSKKGYTGELLKNSGEMGLSVVGEELRQNGIMCGACSGRDTDKAKKFGIALTDADVIKPKLVANSRVAFECRLENTVDVGDHTLYICSIVAIHGDPSVKALYAMDGYRRLDTLE